MAEKETLAVRLQLLLSGATATDLEQIDAQIGKARGELAALERVRRILDLQVNGKKAAPHKKKATSDAPQSPSGANGRGATFDAYRREAVRFLAKRGAGRQADVAEACMIPHGSVTAVFNHPWFQKTDQGIHITTQARQDVL